MQWRPLALEGLFTSLNISVTVCIMTNKDT